MLLVSALFTCRGGAVVRRPRIDAIKPRRIILSLFCPPICYSRRGGGRSGRGAAVVGRNGEGSQGRGAAHHLRHYDLRGRFQDVARDSCRKDEQLDYLVLAVGKPQASKSHLTTWFSCSGVKSHPAKRIFAPASLTLLPVSLPSSNGESRKSTR